MSKPGAIPNGSKVLPKRRHSISVIATSTTSSSPPPPVVTKQDKQRTLSIPNGSVNHERRRGSLIPIGESVERFSGVLPAVPAALNSVRRSVVVVSPPLDEKLSSSRSSSRRTSTTTTTTTTDEISADLLISEYFRAADEAAILGNRRDSLPQASDEFASVMSEMAENISITVNIA